MTQLSRHRAQALAAAVLIGAAACGATAAAAQTPAGTPPRRIEVSGAIRTDSTAPNGGARPLTLEEALRIAEDRSEGVRIARAGVLRARGQQYQARSQYLPQFTGGVTFVKTLQSQFDALSKLGSGGAPDTSSQSLANSPIARIFAARQTLTLGINGQWNVFTAGRSLAANRIAGAARRSAEIGLASALASLQLQVTEAYYDAALAEQLSTIADSSLAQSERTLSQVTLAKNVGNTSEFELLRAQVTRDNQRPTVIQRRTQRDIALLRLKQLLDIPASDDITLASALSDTSSLVTFAADVAAPNGSGTDTTAANRAQVRQVAEAVKVQRDQFRIARAQRLPALQLSTAYGRIGYPTSGLPQWNAFFPNWTVTAALSIPLFTGGRITGDEMVARANLTEARENLQQTKELAALDARAALADLEQAIAAWRASSGTSEQAAKAYRIAEVRYTEGISTQLELSESRLLLEQAAANRASAARNLKVAQVRMALIRDLPLGTVQQGAAGASGAGAGGAGASGSGAQQGGTTQQPSAGQSASGANTTNSFGGQ
ncbi:MAG: TolC family protein [Gemmatimonadaceae bacterium]